MDSGTIRDSSNDLNSRGTCRWNKNSKVYTRRFHRKANKASNNSDTAATTTASTAGSPSAAAAGETSSNPTTAPNPTNVSSSPVAATTSAKDSSAPTSEDFKDHPEVSAAASTPPPTTSSSYAAATPPRADPTDDEPLEPLEALASKDADSCQQSVRELSLGPEKSPSHNSVDKNEILRTSDGEPHNLGESSPLSCANGFSNDREGASAQIPIGIESDNDRQLVPVSHELPSGNETAVVNGVVKPLVISRVDDKIRFKLVKETSKDEIKELTSKLEFQLDQVRRLVEQVEAKELELASCNTQISNSNLSNSNYIGTEGGNNYTGGHSYSQPQHARNELVDRRVLMRVSSEMGMVGHQEIRSTGLSRVNSDVGSTRNLEPRIYSRQLTVAVMENNHGAGEFIEKEKRTPKANQYYRKSEFLLGKDRLPPESNKRSKTNNGRKRNGETGFDFDKSRNQAFRSCSSLLQRLMKHKHAWVFNEPVNAKALGLVDYYDIIKHPMDLGTIKTRLSQNWYKVPREFAEDVRLVFRNAMTYNPKGQDVHIMAEELSQIFEEKWATIETEYNPYWKYQMYQDAGVPTPTSRKAPSQSHFAPAATPFPLYVPSAAPQMRTLDRPESMTATMAVDPKIQRTHVGRRPVPKKPKAKDLDKRDMTYEEKQRLSTKLQSLPTEKLDAIVQIIKKRSTALSQHDDEIEVDIDNVDAETLWELDRFVSNYRKSLSKNKRKAELALQARSASKASKQTVGLTDPTAAVADVQTENGTAFEKSAAPHAAEGEQQLCNGRSSSSSSSSSDGSSSDSDSDSSSENGSDAGHSPGT